MATLYYQNWAPGNSLFSSGATLASPWQYSRAADGADPLYPEMKFATDVLVNGGGQLDFDPSDVGSDYQNAGVHLDTFPTALVLDLGGYVKAKYRPNAQSLADNTYAPLISIADGGTNIELSADIGSGTLFFAGSGFFPATFSFNSAWVPVVDTDYTFEIRWTPVGGGDYDVECLVNGVVIYTELAFALFLGGAGDYEVMEITLGFAGLFGPNYYVEVGDLVALVQQITVQNQPPCCSTGGGGGGVGASPSPNPTPGGLTPPNPLVTPTVWVPVCTGGGLPPTASDPTHAESWP